MNPTSLSTIAALAIAGLFVTSNAHAGGKLTGCLKPSAKMWKIATGSRPAAPCDRDEAQVTWNRVGPKGERGAAGSSCSVGNDGFGTVTISCGDGTATSFAVPHCGNGLVEAGEACDGGDDCTDICTFDTCEAEGGVKVGGACWFLSDSGDSCQEACDAANRTYDAATRTYAGSDGTDAQCYEVLDALRDAGAPMGWGTDSESVTNIGMNGFGCFASDFEMTEGYWYRARSQTNSSKSGSTMARACACQ